MDSNRVKRIIRHQFDLELLLKQRELKLIELEIERGREIRACLEKLLVNEVVYPDRFTRHEYAAFSGGPSPAPQLHTPNTLRKSISMPGLTGDTSAQPSATQNSFQYEMRADGAIVKLRCPACLADKFKSMLGFINHCRIHCHIIFTSPEERQQRAGVVVDPASVPPEFFSRHPTVLKQEQDLAAIRADLQPLFCGHHQGASSGGGGSLYAPSPVKAGESEQQLEDKLLTGNGPLTGEVTRFCIHKRVIIGNDARCLRAGESKNAQCTHSWRLYLRSPPPNIAGQQDCLSRWIRFVRFHLHPSFVDPVVDVHKEPFELSRDTFGEFPVRIQLHFWDSKRNAPYDLIHHVKVFQAVAPGKSIGGPERMYEVELDRSTDFSLVGSVNDALLQGPASAPHINSDYEVLQAALQKTTNVSIPPFANLLTAEKAKLSYCEGICEQIKVRNAGFCLSAHEILSWLSSNRPDFFDADHRDSSTAAGQSEQLQQEPLLTRFCCYCGQPHEPASRFEVLQKNCSFKPRKIRLSSRTDLSLFVAGRYAMNDTPLSDESSRYTAVGNRPTGRLLVDSVDADSTSLIQPVHEGKMSGEARIVCNALVRVFAKRLLARAITAAHDASTRPPGHQAKPVVLTPLHVYSALTVNQCADNPMDFITQENMQA